MSDRPTFDGIRREEESFIGPPEPQQGPKIQRSLTEADEAYADTLATLSAIRSALEAGRPVDPKQLPVRLVEIIEAYCVRPNMPIVDGRPHYQVDDVVQALDILRGDLPLV